MAMIAKANPKSSSGGYDRVFDNAQLGKLMQKVQSTCISNGTELEKIVQKEAVLIPNGDLDAFIKECNCKTIPEGRYLCTKKAVKNSQFGKKNSHSGNRHEPDLIIFKIDDKGCGNCYIVELKDGDSFDTKKSDGEYHSLEEFCNKFGAAVPFITNFYICCFNQLDKKSIVDGFKKRFDIEHVMTGKELCELLSIDYQKILTLRKQDAKGNLTYFIKEITKIASCKAELGILRKEHIDQSIIDTEYLNDYCED